MYKILSKFREDMQLRGFSRHIIRSYTECVTEYLSLLNKPLSEKTEYDVREFKLYYRNQQCHLYKRTPNRCFSQLFGVFWGALLIMLRVRLRKLSSIVDYRGKQGLWCSKHNISQGKHP